MLKILEQATSRGQTKPTVVALSLGAASLAAVRVSTLPDDLAFMLPSVLVVWLGVFLALRPKANARVLSRWVTVPCWLWLLALAANPVYSVWPEMSIWCGLMFALIPASILGLHSWLADDRVWHCLQWLLLSTTALVAAAMLFEYFGLGQRADGLFADANVASAVLYVALLPLFYRLMTRHERLPSTWLLAALGLVLSTGFFTAFSRAGIIVVVTAMLGTALVVLATRQRTIAVRFGVCLVLLAVGYALVHYVPEQSIQRDWNNLSQDRSLDARFLMWQSTLQIYADAPLLGHGLGTYKQLYPRYRSLAETASSGDMAHNDYLQVLAGGGPLMLALLAAFVLSVLGTGLWLLWRIHDTRAGPEQNALVGDIGLCAALLALFVHATVNFIFFSLLLSLFSAMYAARLAGRHATVPQAPARRRLSGRLPAVVRPLIGVVALYSVVTIGAGAVAVHAFHFNDPDATVTPSLGSPNYRLALAISYIDPLNYRAKFYIALAESSTAARLGPEGQGTDLAAVALADSRDLLSRIKYPDCSVLANAGVLLTTFDSKQAVLKAKGVWQDPAVLLRRTVTVLPTCIPAWLALGRVWAQRDNPKRSIAVLKEATKWIHIPTVKPEYVAQLLVTVADHLAAAGNKVKAMKIMRSVLNVLPEYHPARALLARVSL